MRRFALVVVWLLTTVLVSAIVASVVATPRANGRLVLPLFSQPTPVVVGEAIQLAGRLDLFAANPGSPQAQQNAVAAEHLLQAQAEHDQTAQSAAVLQLLPRIDAAIQSRNALEMNRLAIELRAIQ
jgi:hypothetical protein